MPRQGYTKSGERTQLPFSGKKRETKHGALSKMDSYPPEPNEVIRVEPQVKFSQDSKDWDACLRDGGPTRDYD